MLTSFSLLEHDLIEEWDYEIDPSTIFHMNQRLYWFKDSKDIYYLTAPHDFKNVNAIKSCLTGTETIKKMEV